MTKTESAVQLQSRTVEICNCLNIKNDIFFNFQNDELYDIKNEINGEIEMKKSIILSILEDQAEPNNQICHRVSSFVSENELILSEIKKKSEVFHSKNYYHLIDKGDLDQSDDQSNFRPSENINHNHTNKVIATQNHHLSRLSYSSLSLFKNSVSASSLKEKSDTVIKNKSLSIETLSEKTSNYSLISAHNPIHFYCLLKYRIKHLLKYK